MAADLSERQGARAGPGVSAGHSEIGRENRALRDLVALYRHLSGLALQNADIATVTRLIAERTGATVAVVGPRMDVLAAAFPPSPIPEPTPDRAAPDEAAADPAGTGQAGTGQAGVERAGTDRAAADYVAENVVHPRLAQVLGASGLTRRALRLPDAATGSSVVVAPILVGDDVPAYLITLDGDADDGTGEDLSLLLTEHAATICGVILGRERIVTAAAGRARDDLVEGLLSARGHDAAEIARWAAHLGYDPARDHRVLTIALDPALLDPAPLTDLPRAITAEGPRTASTESARPASTEGTRPASTEGPRSASREGARLPSGDSDRPARPSPPGERSREGRRPDAPGPARIEAARADDGVTRRAAETVEHLLTSHTPDAIVSIRDTEVVAVLTEPQSRPGAPEAPGPQRLGELCLERLAALFPGVPVVVGIGGMCRDPAELSRSYEEARRAVETLRRAGRHGRVVAFDALGIHRLLLQVPGLESLRAFAAEVFGRTGAQGERAAPYLTTLACYFQENNSPRRAARRLHVHPNTVTYRVRRVEEITGLDFTRYRDRLMAQVALEILDALGDLDTEREAP